MGRQVFLLCDSTKFTAGSFANFGTLKDVDCVITDSGIDSTILAGLKKLDCHVEVV